MLEIIKTTSSQAPIGPYSQAVKANGFIFCSGTAGVDPKTGKLVNGFENQVRQVFNNLKEVLFEAGSNFANVVKVTIFLKEMKHFATMNTIYQEIFGKHKPARTTVEVLNLPKDGALIVVELIASSQK